MHHSLTNHFLIAMPQLTDPGFARTVTYICEHSEQGALGIVINRPLDMQLTAILEHMQLSTQDAAIGRLPVYHGGPVQPERGFVLHEPLGGWESTLRVTGTIGITSSRDILTAMASGAGPQQTLVALGYAGWASGQLERELADNAWLSSPADARIIFETPNPQRWEAAVALLGIEAHSLSAQTGHA